MIQQPVAKSCLACGKTVRGRSDKKFCGDYCRNVYNNEMKSGTNHLIRNITNTIRKNRRILKDAIPEGRVTTRLSREQLLASGFQFRYGTHYFVNSSGQRYFFCYDYGYLQIDQDCLLVVSQRPDRRKMAERSDP